MSRREATPSRRSPRSPSRRGGRCTTWSGRAGSRWVGTTRRRRSASAGSWRRSTSTAWSPSGCCSPSSGAAAGGPVPEPAVRPSSIDGPTARSACRSRLAATSARRSSWRRPSSGCPAPSGVETLAEVARERGASIGSAARRGPGRGKGRRAPLRELVEVLGGAGFEPDEVSDDTMCLRNCPYDALVADHRDVTCGMNLAWAEGVVEGLGARDVTRRAGPRARALLRRLPRGIRRPPPRRLTGSSRRSPRVPGRHATAQDASHAVPGQDRANRARQGETVSRHAGPAPIPPPALDPRHRGAPRRACDSNPPVTLSPSTPTVPPPAASPSPSTARLRGALAVGHRRAVADRGAIPVSVAEHLAPGRRVALPDRPRDHADAVPGRRPGRRGRAGLQHGTVRGRRARRPGQAGRRLAVVDRHRQPDRRRRARPGRVPLRGAARHGHRRSRLRLEAAPPVAGRGGAARVPDRPAARLVLRPRRRRRPGSPTSPASRRTTAGRTTGTIFTAVSPDGSSPFAAPRAVRPFRDPGRVRHGRPADPRDQRRPTGPSSGPWRPTAPRAGRPGRSPAATRSSTRRVGSA